MERALRTLGLSALLLVAASSRAAAQEPRGGDGTHDTEADTHHNTEEPKAAEQPAPVLEPSASTATAPPAALAAPPAAVPPAAGPKLGDVSITGYFRGGFGASNQKGRMTCFQLANPSGLFSKYRLGNECEVWSETHFTVVTYAGDDGSVATAHFMPTIFIPTTNIGYSPTATIDSPLAFTTSTGATLSFPNLYVDIKGIPWLHGGTAWIGSRYYKRESVYISDFFYWNPSGVGGGIEDINLGKDLRLSYAAFAVDGPPATNVPGTNPQLPPQFDFGVRNDVQLRGIRPWEGGELQLGFQYIADDSNDMPGTPATHSGWGATLQFVQQVLGGDNKLALQYGKGAGTGFGTLARFYYPDFALNVDPVQYRFRVVDVLTIQPTPWFGAQLDGVYQRDQNFLGSPGQYAEWISAGTRVSWAFTRHAKLLGEVGYDRVTRNNTSPLQPQELAKLTIAPTLTTGRGLMTRPELRLFYTWAVWNAAARTATVDSGMLYTATNLLSGSIFGLQAETWY
ncbi:MAG TPA: carbohydrate porin [Polyangia bacterium]|nr:carbohydrate porin [Polyangia bacterium]